MRPVKPVYRHILKTSHTRTATVDSYYRGKLIARQIPVIDGSVTYDDSAVIRRRLVLTVAARELTGQQWDPGSTHNHPLAAYGQRLRLAIRVGLPDGPPQVFDHGWYLITSWERNEEEQTVSVTADDLSRLIVDWRHISPESPTGKGLYSSEFARIAGVTSLPVRISTELTDRKVNAQTVYERERDKNLSDLAKGWPARWFVDDAGTVRVEPPYPAPRTPVTVFQDGMDGTIVNRSRGATRDRVYNAVVVTGKQPEGDDKAKPPFAVAQLTDRKNPINVHSGYGFVPRFYTSDMITTNAEATRTAKDLLALYTAPGRTESLTAVPDPSLELGDTARVYSGGDEFTGRITALELPLSADGGAMSATVSNALPDDEDESY